MPKSTPIAHSVTAAPFGLASRTWSRTDVPTPSALTELWIKSQRGGTRESSAKSESRLAGEKRPAHKLAPMLRFGLFLAALVFAADQASKWYVLGPLALNPPDCLAQEIGCGFIELGPVVDLQMVWNRGISFGLLRADQDFARWALVAAQLGIAGVFGWWLRTAERKITGVALGLVIGGALGNVIDRIRYGAVADFIDFSGPWFGWRIGDWPVGFGWVFNVADAAITIGAIVLAVDMVFFSEEPGKGTLWAQARGGVTRVWSRLRGAPDRS